MVNQSPDGTLLKRLLEHDALRIIGFIADMLAITAALLAINFPNPGAALSAFVSLPFILIIWLIALYTYVCILHDYWSKTKESLNWSSRFWGFVGYNLFLGLSKPWLLFPLVLLLVVPYTLIYLASGGGGAGAVNVFGSLVISSALTLFVQIMFSDPIAYARSEEHERGLAQSKAVVDEKWKTLKPIIKKRLLACQWMTEADLKDIFLLHNIKREVAGYIFARYVTEAPDQAYWGNVYKRRPNNVNTGDQIAHMVLINISNFNSQVYFYKGN